MDFAIKNSELRCQDSLTLLMAKPHLDVTGVRTVFPLAIDPELRATAFTDVHLPDVFVIFLSCLFPPCHPAAVIAEDASALCKVHDDLIATEFAYSLTAFFLRFNLVSLTE